MKIIIRNVNEIIFYCIFNLLEVLSAIYMNLESVKDNEIKVELLYKYLLTKHINN